MTTERLPFHTAVPRSLRPALLVLAVLLCLAAPAAAKAYTIGMSDQKVGMWQDPRFAKLGIKQVRLLMAYDNVLRRDFSRYDAWMTAAHRRGADVLVTIDRDIGSYTRMPSLKQYRKVVRILRKRYPWVDTYGAWNEANHVKQPTYRKPKRAAQYYNILREECAGCTILAADLLDSKNMLSWVAAFQRYAKRPKLWGLHSYQDSNHFRPLSQTYTRALLRAVKGDLWLTEAGGIVRFGTRYRGGKAGERHAARAMKRTFKIAGSSRRIKRLYLYHWDADPKFRSWDSAFVDNRGRARPTLEILRRQINRQRRRANEPTVPALGKKRGKQLPL
jgi:polysaccharide biosynthesis protein PslG